MKDLTAVAKKVEQLLTEELGERPSFALVITAPPKHDTAHWVTNVSRLDGMLLLQKASRRMQAEVAQSKSTRNH